MHTDVTVLLIEIKTIIIINIIIIIVCSSKICTLYTLHTPGALYTWAPVRWVAMDSCLDPVRVAFDSTQPEATSKSYLKPRVYSNCGHTCWCMDLT